MNARRRAALVLTTLLLAGGCNDCDLGGNNLEVLAPDVSVSPDALDFGALWEGEPLLRSVVLANKGNAPASVITVEIVGDGFELAAPPPELVTAGEELSLQVTALGVVAQTTAALHIVTDTGTSGTFEATIPLTARVSPVPDCTDGNPCTDDRFDTDGELCLHTFNTGGCGGDDPCVIDGQCINGDCVGEALACPGGSACSVGACTPGVGCEVELNDSLCDDDDPCTSDTCGADGCVFTPLAEASLCAPADGCESVHLCTAGVCTPYPVPDGFPCETDAVCTVGQCAAGVCEEVPIVSPPDIVDVATGFGGHEAGAVAIGDGRLVIVDRISRETLRLSTVTFDDGGGETVWADVRTLPAEAPAGRVELLRVGDKAAVREGQGPFTRLVGPGPDDVIEPIPQDEGPVMWIEASDVLRAVCVPIEGLDSAWVYRWHDGILDERVGVTACRPRAFAVAGDRLFTVTAPGALAVSTLQGSLVSDGHWLDVGTLGVVASEDHVLAHNFATAGVELGAGTWLLLSPEGQSQFSITTTSAPLIVGDDAIFDNSQGLVTRSLLVAEGLWEFSSPVDGTLSTDGDTLVARPDNPWIGPQVLRRLTTFLPRSPPGMGDKQRVVGPYDDFVWVAGPSGSHFALDTGAGLAFDVSSRQPISGVIDNQADGPQLSSAVIGEPGLIGVGAQLGSFVGTVEIHGTTRARVDRYAPPSDGMGPPSPGEWSIVVDALWSPAADPLPLALPLASGPVAGMVPKLAFAASGNLAAFVPWGPPRLLFIDVSPTELVVDGELPYEDVLSLAYDDDRVAFVIGPEPLDPVSPTGLNAVEVWLREGSELTLVGEVPDLEGPRVLRFLDRFLAVDTADGLLYVDTTVSPPAIVAELPVEGRITDARVIDGELLVVTPQDLVVIDPPCPAL